MPFELPNLPYTHGALEPYIDQRTMEIHHGKHHQAYTTNLNKALEDHASLQSKSIYGEFLIYRRESRVLSATMAVALLIIISFGQSSAQPVAVLQRVFCQRPSTVHLDHLSILRRNSLQPPPHGSAVDGLGSLLIPRVHYTCIPRQIRIARIWRAIFLFLVWMYGSMPIISTIKIAAPIM